MVNVTVDLPDNDTELGEKYKKVTPRHPIDSKYTIIIQDETHDWKHNVTNMEIYKKYYLIDITRTRLLGTIQKHLHQTPAEQFIAPVNNGAPCLLHCRHKGMVTTRFYYWKKPWGRRINTEACQLTPKGTNLCCCQSAWRIISGVSRKRAAN